MFCTNPRPWRRLRLGVTPFEGVLSENAGDRLREMIFGPCNEGFGFGSAGRASVGVFMFAAGREGRIDITEGEGLRRGFGVETGSVGDLDPDDGSVSVRPGRDTERNAFRGRSCLTSPLSGLGVYECRCKLGVDDIERLLWA